ncbi:EF-P 5-aminopentanol modification-associated protein YfmH [Paenactinomyces guangxiensis]|uniref:Insulinase family protein n=1 Tax=Paenactinomyces guangxiensis TaxID=1490290 RepID=A0A7W2A7C6_9BACL|nr:pitrilysin family protein [Paenactinomyces guangxiensis]MBA4494401.1 insulinase family protein [Paenactinomyces guangxiensis]MBH8591544.1 insulinase family protein [Paenactinomyces guangxiensis]
MHKIEHPQIQETLYHEKLSNGLEVYILPKPEFSKTYATFTTKYGSIDNTFQVPGQDKINVPDGIAHFLEHKMFEQETGEDVFQEFARQGASANAFTSFTRTAYLFSCTDHVEQNLSTLLNFVQSPYFTDQNVEKEKGIIGQEIRMYDDNPDWRSYFGLIEAMYQKHPVKIDIAGTVESISKITKETLYTCYETFYHPNNMLLFLVGPVEPDAMINLIKENQARKSFKQQPEIKRFFEEEPDKVAEKKKEVQLSVGISKCLFGFKEGKAAIGHTGESLLKQELTTSIVLEALVGPSSELYQSLYDDGLVDDNFGYDYTLEKGYGFSMMGGDTPDPNRLLERIQSEIPPLVERGISEEAFERIRKKKVGSSLRFLNSPEWIANQFTSYRFNDTDLFRIIPLLESLTLEEVNQRMKEHLNWDRFAVSLVRPLQEQN